ncbi:MAG: desulfoferrodoxin [Bacilli bacterium]|nr:desulfoferrodoxin [Bacilli bacterium]
MKICKCNVCGNVISILDDNGGKLICCNEEMELMVPESSDGAREKHVPVITKDGDEIIVSVGSVAHPMDDDHYINWIALVNDDVVTRVNLNPNDEPEARFPYTKGSIVYAYCDKHGLWKAIVD